MTLLNIDNLHVKLEDEDREIIRGLNSRDPAKAAAAMKAHLDAAYRSTVAVLDGPGLG